MRRVVKMTVKKFETYHKAKTNAKKRTRLIVDDLEKQTDGINFPNDMKPEDLEKDIEKVLYESELFGIKNKTEDL